MTTDQVITRDQHTFLRLGRDDIAIPEPLAAQLPAAVLADLLNLAPTTAVRWVHDAGGDWSRYAAELLHTADHQP